MLLNFADINLSQRGSLYFELYQKIRAAVSEGAIKKGERMPSVREAAAQLGVSRTTVENAYTRLCIEGIIESRPQRGYFVIGKPRVENATPKAAEERPKIIYDFSGRLVDKDGSDTELWKKSVRSVLWDSGELNSYGDPQGEMGLRLALADYSYKARGVITSPKNIVIGAGVGPLLNILCGLLGRSLSVGFENGGFKEARQIFSDYGIKAFDLPSDKNGACETALTENDPDILFLMPSALSKISPNALALRRNLFSEWCKTKNRLIIEDDYNGELRYTARSVPAFQRNAPQSTIYIGSFSKLLLPSVRIAYMVLPDFLADKFHSGEYIYNQTCGKIEQLALEKYIASGALEKHLKRLRRIYYTKSQLLIRELENNLTDLKELTLFESSLTVRAELKRSFDTELIKKLECSGIRLADFKNSNTLYLCFSGIDSEKIPDGINFLSKILKNM